MKKEVNYLWCFNVTLHIFYEIWLVCFVFFTLELISLEKNWRCYYLFYFNTKLYAIIFITGVDIRSSKVCELGLLNYKAKDVFHHFERSKFRCRYDYYWASVFKVIITCCHFWYCLLFFIKRRNIFYLKERQGISMREDMIFSLKIHNVNMFVSAIKRPYPSKYMQEECHQEAMVRPPGKGRGTLKTASIHLYPNMWKN